MAYDLARARMVLWLAAAQQTWELVGSDWIRINTNTPPRRSFGSLAFDPLTQRLMAHGGDFGFFNRTNETWLYDGATWTLASTAGPVRAGSALAFDATRNRMLLTGGGTGFTPLPGVSNEMWDWDGTTWTRLATVAPVAASGPGTFDMARNRYVWVATVGFGLRQFWEWDGTAWSLGGSLSSLISHVTYEASRGVCVTIGSRETGTWNGTTWNLVDSTVLSGATPQIATDLARSRIVFMPGGITSSTWEWDAGRWSAVASGPPSDAEGAALTYDLVRARTVLFGGTTTATHSDFDTWLWNGQTWTRATPATSPPGRQNARMVWDDARQHVLLFGGSGPQTLSDTWKWDGQTWTQLTPTVSPTPRELHGMAYDSVRQRTVVFGGLGPPELRDTWEWDGTNWSLVATTGPSARRLHGMAYDPLRARVVLYSGLVTSAERSTWEWDGAEWTNTPVPLTDADVPVLAIEPGRGLLAVAAGQGRTLVQRLVYDGVGVPCHAMNSGGAGLAIDNARPHLGDSVVATVTADVAGTAAFLALGTTILAPALDLSILGLPACRAHIAFTDVYMLPLAGGSATWTGVVPNSTAFVGVRFALQALASAPAVPAGVTTTNAVALRVQP